MGKEKNCWWDWRENGHEEEAAEAMRDEMKLAALEELAKRCVVLDNLAPNNTRHTMKTALGQFGMVLGVKMLRNDLTLKFAGIAIAEMATMEQRDQVVKELRDYLFMIGQMPRPARAIPATPLLMLDHPWRRYPKNFSPRLVSQTDPEFESLWQRAQKDRIKVADEQVLQQVLDEEELSLARTQEKICKEAMEKLNMIAQERRAGTITELKKMFGEPTSRDKKA